MKVDGYIRVSRTGGRAGPSYITEDVQRETIERLVAAHGLELGEVVAERDVSGSRRVEDRELGRLIERVERGESGGVVVWKISRFSRSLAGSVVAAKRITSAGGRLLAGDFDSAGPMGNALLGLMSGLAEDDLDARREGWEQTRRRHVERGVANGRAPLGYRKRPDGRFEVVEREAAKVRDAFERRAAGEPLAAIGRRYGWSHSTVRQILANVAYLGVARSGAFVHESAHPALVERELWERAQGTPARSPLATGALTAERLLQGVAYCAGCGRTLKVVHRRRADGSRVSSYYCKDAAADTCDERAFVHADQLDEYVGDWFLGALASAPRMVDVVAVGRELEAAQVALAAAERELAAFVELGDSIERELFQRGYAARVARRDEAREKVGHLAARLPSLPAGGSIVNFWDGFDAAERREVLAGYLGRVVVSRGASADLAGHVSIEWPDGSVANDERRVRKAAA